MAKIAIGTLVRGWTIRGRGGEPFEGTLESYADADQIVRLLITKDSATSGYKAGMRISVWADVQVVRLPIDPQKPMKTRAGWSAKVLRLFPGGKSIRATVDHPNHGPLTLTFSASGCLYKDLESPVDLINA